MLATKKTSWRCHLLLGLSVIVLLLPREQIHSQAMDSPLSSSSSFSSFSSVDSDPSSSHSDSESDSDSDFSSDLGDHFRNLRIAEANPLEHEDTPADVPRYHIYNSVTGSFHRPHNLFMAMNVPNPVRDNADFPHTRTMMLEHVARLMHLPDGPEKNRVATVLANINNRVDAMNHLKMVDGRVGGIIKSEPTGLIFYNPAIRKKTVKRRVAAGNVPILRKVGDRYYFNVNHV